MHARTISDWAKAKIAVLAVLLTIFRDSSRFP